MVNDLTLQSITTEGINGIKPLVPMFFTIAENIEKVSPEIEAIQMVNYLFKHHRYLLSRIARNIGKEEYVTNVPYALNFSAVTVNNDDLFVIIAFIMTNRDTMTIKLSRDSVMALLESETDGYSTQS